MITLAILTIILCSFSLVIHLGVFIEDGCILMGFIASSPEILSIMMCTMYLGGR